MTRSIKTITITISLLALAMMTMAHAKPQSWQVGKGKPQFTMVFMHGWNGRPPNFLCSRLARKLARRGYSFKVVEPDLRNGQKFHSMSTQLRAAEAAIGAADPSIPVVLAGHSLGGKGALYLARSSPLKDRVKGMVLLAPSTRMLYSFIKGNVGKQALGPGAPLPTAQHAQRVLAEYAEKNARAAPKFKVLREAKAQLATVTPGARIGQWIAAKLTKKQAPYKALETKVAARAAELKAELSALGIRRTVPRGALPFYQDLARYGERDKEQGVEKPGLVIHGTKDRAVSFFYAQRLVGENPGLKMMEAKGAGHGLRGLTRAMANQVASFLESDLQIKPATPASLWSRIF